MTNSILKITMSGLMAAGLVAYGQQSKEPAAPAQAPAKPQSAEQVFAMLDTDKDGKLTAEEFGKLFRDAKVSDVQTEFAKWDKNGDKSISMDEFKAGYPEQH